MVQEPRQLRFLRQRSSGRSFVTPELALFYPYTMKRLVRVEERRRRAYTRALTRFFDDDGILMCANSEYPCPCQARPSTWRLPCPNHCLSLTPQPSRLAWRRRVGSVSVVFNPAKVFLRRLCQQGRLSIHPMSWKDQGLTDLRFKG